MKRNTWVTLAIVAVVGVLAVAIAASGGAGKASAGPQATLKAAMVSDTGNINDRSFNQLSKKGLDRAKTELKATTRVFISNSASEYLPNFTAAGRANFNAIVATGFLLGDSMSTAAMAFPKSKFAIVDFPWAALKDKPKNAIGLTFKSEQSGYLVGYLAGLMAKKQGGKQVVSAVGGKKLPSVDNWIAGFFAGAKKANPKIKTLVDYSDQFSVQFAAKCKELALKQIAQGSQAIFQVAGGCGLGALDAAKANHKSKKRPVWGIGVDADQGYLGKHILTSGTKKVDVATFRFYKSVKEGTFKGSRDFVGTLRNGLQGVGRISSVVPKTYITQMNRIKKLIIKGKIKPPAKL
ncbi:MAG TPA: BMP family ABC transporter substrate-binding protein [Gaiellaceae bacterium]|nr:BMP family ABC transporter substrate-binding protein [Gaiellaceae bacterium]